MKTKNMYVTALIVTLLAVIPTLSQASCDKHKSQQAGNETSVGGKAVASGEGTGVSQNLSDGSGLIAGGEGTGVEQPLQNADMQFVGGEGTGVEGQALVDSNTSPLQ